MRGLRDAPAPPRRAAGGAGRGALLLAALFAFALPARAQTPDSTAAPPAAPPPVTEPAPEATPADSVEVGGAAVLPRPSVAPFGPAPGRPVTPVPALTAALAVETLLADRPGAFAYAASAPGRVGGVAFDGLGLDLPALALDGRPYTDPFTGAPRYDLLPAAAVGPLRLVGAAFGRPGGVAAAVRPFRLGVPVTEIRYGAGGEGVQQVSGTHAQTRRPPAFLRGGSDDARLTGTLHVANRRSNGVAAGGTLRHLDVLGRLLLTRPGLAAELGVVHADRTVGARLGVVAAAGRDPFDGLFLETAAVPDAAATRRTLRTEVWARARLPILAATPLDVGGAVAFQRLVVGEGQADTLRLWGRRLTAFAEQAGRAGAHHLSLRLDVVAEGAARSRLVALGLRVERDRDDARLDLHLALRDSVRLGPLALAAEGGASRLGGALVPTAALRAEAGPLYADVRYGGRARARVDAGGLAGRFEPSPGDGERALAAEAGLALRGGPWRLALRAYGARRTGVRELVATDSAAFAFASVPGALREGGVGVSAGWREAARRGFYVRGEGTARALAGAEDGLPARLDAALPRVWGALRIGVRAEGVGDGVLDLDLAAVGRAWSAFTGRRIEPATGLLALPAPAGPFAVALPAQATLGLEATATFSERASIFLRYDNALAERVTTGAAVLQGEPLAPHVFRFGVFWALLD
ncbi:hypothetical protein [Rubrivirga litoralis]|uniref:TonB-dependent receptor n=1 Tax=Rubrivirga litoralis TaxID=3075598 RepID=A0ABU3BQ40_9BACT|nr:hypothetical protein [Rubrivirga sp. F394]MDT0631389.1 hypothetical protein [Rubrivirga sp. F394]